MKPLLLALMAALPLACPGQDTVPNVFVQALRDGHAAQALSQDMPFGPVRRAIQARTGGGSPVVILANRLLRFQQQPECGRVAFVLAQPGSHQAWAELGGQLNICASGAPPLRACEDRPDQLLAPEARCSDGKSPQDTPEVAAAIAQALHDGGLSPAQVRQQLLDAHPLPTPEKRLP